MNAQNIEQAMKDYSSKGFYFVFSGYNNLTVNYFGGWNQQAQAFDVVETGVYESDDWTFFELFATLDLWAETHKERME